jgi:hypothetical protein
MRFSKKIVQKPKAQFTGKRLSVNAEFRNEFAKPEPFFARANGETEQFMAFL